MKKLLRVFVVSVSLVPIGSVVAQCSETGGLKLILQKEAKGQPIDRRAELKSGTLDEQTAWHAGKVRIDEGWQSFEKFEPSALDADYEAKRAEYWNQADGHLTLARWCKKNALNDRARAHYFGHLAIEPNHNEARDFLGHVAVDGAWVDKTELQTARDAMQESMRQLAIWTPKLEKILRSIRSGQTKKMSAALEELDGIDATEALPALTIFASNIDDDLAKPLIRKIAEVRSRQACQALVQVALKHPSSEVRLTTAKYIKSFPNHYYVPDLLAMLVGETEYADQLVMHPSGNITMETLVTTELQNKTIARQARNFVNVIAHFNSSRSMMLTDSVIADRYVWSIRFGIDRKRPLSLGEGEINGSRDEFRSDQSLTYIPREVLANAAISLQEQSRQNERAKAELNRANDSHANHICTLLRATTDESIDNEPQAWWQWWNDVNERYQGAKPLDFASSTSYKQIGVNLTQVSRDTNSTYRHAGKSLVQYSCLVPGTLVQTSTGMVAIEVIKVGDLVLSQNVETAELDYKPVLMTTVRPPKSTIKIVTESETIDATGGHNWWVSGLGWTTTSRLKPGMSLHTATGAITIKELIESPEKKETFNLVVDEFNTYFVGPERVLSYDNSQLRPSLRILPGYNEVAVADVKKN